MALLGQASGGFTESSSALRILHVGIRNTVGILTDDAFTQTNPPVVTTSAGISTSAGMDTATLGVLSGSVAFARPDVGSNYIGGNVEGTSNPTEEFIVPLGLFINNAVGNAYENTPGPASGKGPYVSGQGTYASSLFENKIIDGSVVTASTGDAITYISGMFLVASRNGYLQASWDLVNDETLDVATLTAEVEHGQSASTILGVCKMPADSVQPEIVFDQRI